eukprot:jgi/Hompol1/3597/HPOL_003297-RA
MSKSDNSGHSTEKKPPASRQHPPSKSKNANLDADSSVVESVSVPMAVLLSGSANADEEPLLAIGRAAEPPTTDLVKSKKPPRKAQDSRQLTQVEPSTSATATTTKKPSRPNSSGLMTYPIDEDIVVSHAHASDSVEEYTTEDISVYVADAVSDTRTSSSTPENEEQIDVKSVGRTASKKATSGISPKVQSKDSNIESLSNEEFSGEASWNRVQKTKGFVLDPQQKGESKGNNSVKGKHDKNAKSSKVDVIEKLKMDRDAKRSKLKEDREHMIEKLKREQAEQQIKLMEERASQRLSRKAKDQEQPALSHVVSNPASISENHNQTNADGIAPSPKPPTSGKQATVQRKSIVPAPVKSQSNRTLIKNALMHVCLAGAANVPIQHEVLEDLQESPASHFIILLRDVNNFSFRGLYAWDPTLDQTLKTYSGSLGPNILDTSQVVEFYKYDSGARTFKAVPTKSFGRSVHAVAIARDVSSQHQHHQSPMKSSTHA